MRGGPTRPRGPARLVLALVATALVAVAAAPPAAAQTTTVRGSGSSYAAIAIDQWKAEASSFGLDINYLPTGSPQGMDQYSSNTVDYAGSEAEFKSLQLGGGGPSRGSQYVPDVAGAIAVMYNIKDKAGRKVDYLNLSRRTIARIFLGEITSWADPAIRQDNTTEVLPAGLDLPDQKIRVIYRGGPSGTTALFYDFVANTEPGLYGSFVARNAMPREVRILEVVRGDNGQPAIPGSLAQPGSAEIAQFIGTPSGEWSIGYDEFGYAKQYKVPAVWVENEAGEWVRPHARNIASALVDADLRPDLSQELGRVYTSRQPGAYPISAYSYLVTQCAPAPDRNTCKGDYSDPAKSETLARWMRHIACEGQANMARLGYSPLPPNLSQEIANSIGRMRGQPGEGMNAGNCGNPRFRGEFGPGADPDDENPLRPRGGGGGRGGGGAGGAGGPGGAGGADGRGGQGGAGAGGDGAGAGGPGATSGDSLGGEAGLSGDEESAGGGSSADKWRKPNPVGYDRPFPIAASAWPLLMLFILLAVPIVFVVTRPRFAKRSKSPGP